LYRSVIISAHGEGGMEDYCRAGGGGVGGCHSVSIAYLHINV